MKKITGRFIDFSPIIRVGISNDGKFILGKGNYDLIIDSGFTGDISVPKKILNKLEVEYAGTMQFQLADGTVVWKKLWLGSLLCGGNEYEALFIEGDFLLGMELASEVFTFLFIDFVKGKVEVGVRRE